MDIQPIAIQISKLRFFISLICDQRTNKNKAQNCGVRPLPNLETKFVAANTLISLDRGQDQGLLMDQRLPTLEKQLAEIRHKHFAAQRRRDKLALQKKDAALREEIAAVLADGGMSGDASHQLAAWDPYDQNNSAPFFDPEWMYGISDGFHVVIGNPPYLFITAVKEPLKSAYQRMYPTLSYRFDIYGAFIELSLRNLARCPGGVFGYIIPHTLLSNDSFKKLRIALASDSTLLRVVDLGPGVFAGASNETMVLIAAQGSSREAEVSVVTAEAASFPDESETFVAKQSDWANTDGAPWRVRVPPELLKLLAKIEGVDHELGTLTTINQGLRTGDNEKHLASRPRGKAWKPAAGGKHIDRYAAISSGLFVNYVRDELDAPRREEIFTTPEKIVVQEIRNISLRRRIVATLDRTQHYCLQSTNVINLRGNAEQNLRYLLGILNSALVNFYFRMSFPGNNHIPANCLAKIPVPSCSSQEATKIEALVSRILDSKQSDPDGDTSKWEREIDERVFRLYGLTKDEIAIVEGDG